MTLSMRSSVKEPKKDETGYLFVGVEQHSQQECTPITCYLALWGLESGQSQKSVCTSEGETAKGPKCDNERTKC